MKSILKAYAFLGLFFIPFLSEAQTPFTIDSLKFLEEGEAFLAKAITTSSNDSGVYYLQKGLNCFQKSKTKSKILDCYNREASIYYDDENYLKYQEYSLKAAEYAQANLPKENTDYINAMGNLAVFYLFKEDYSKALELLKKNLEIAILDSLNNVLAYDINNIGFIYQHYIGDFERALQYYSKALNATADLVEEDQNLISAILSNKAYCLKEKQLLDSAYQGFQNTLNLISKIEATDFIKQIEWYCYQNLGDICFKRGQKKQGLQLAQKALNLIKNNSAIWDAQLTYETLGNYYLQERNYKKAISHFEKAVTLTKDNPEVHKSVLAACRMADALCEVKKYTAALDTLQSALQILSPGFKNPEVTSNPLAESILHNTSGLELIETKAAAFYGRYLLKKNQSDLEAALDNYQLASQIINIIRQTYAEEGSKNFLAKKSNALYEKAIETALVLYENTGEAKYFDKAFLFSEQNKSVSLLESIRQNMAMGFGYLPPNVLAKEKDLKNEINFTHKLINLKKQEGTRQGKLKELNAQLFEAKENHQDFLDKLEQNFPKYHELKYRPQLASVSKIQQEHLDTETALVEYFVGEKTIFLFCITQKEIKAIRIAKDAQLLESFTFLQEIISTPPDGTTYKSKLAQFNQKAPRLFKKLLSPCDELLQKNIKKLIIIPDDFLNYLPFELLCTAPPFKSYSGYALEEQHYLLEDYQISYNFSASLLLQNRNKRYKTTKPFAGFAPHFNNMDIATARGCENGQLYRLQCAQQEVEDLSKLMNGETFVGLTAQKNQFLQSADQYNILHLATHACLDQDDPNFNRIYFTDDHLSNFDLNNCSIPANLVVLSACNTNSGTLIKGDGVMSLSKGFTLAGCPSTVTSLWAVDDCSTSTLMQFFYQQLKNGKDKDHALQIAKLEYLNTASKANRHPYFWAPFLQSGEVSALSFRTGWPFGKVILLLGLLGLMFYFFKKVF